MAKKKIKSNKLKIALAMSGGVDSSVAAKILKDEGHQVVGLFLKLWSDPNSPCQINGLHGAGPSCNIKKQNRCCNWEALEDARKVAKMLKIPFYVINAEKEFKKLIVDEFISEYKKLKTPNPCVRCNDHIKFGLLLKKALEIGCDKLATGHFARIERSGGKFKLKIGADESKDQSYMLYRLKQNQLSKVIFPLGNYLKRDVRSLASKWDLPVKEKPESQEICFFGDRDYRGFLKRYLDRKYFKPGDIVISGGKIVGSHNGLINYTIGQRKGINQNLKNKREITKILYVVGYDVKKNQLIVGGDGEVYSKKMIVKDLNWINKKIDSNRELEVKIRYRHTAVRCKLDEAISSKSIKVLFNKPQRAVTPGQSAVIYVDDEVMGGGIIQ